MRKFAVSIYKDGKLIDKGTIEASTEYQANFQIQNRILEQYEIKLREE